MRRSVLQLLLLLCWRDIEDLGLASPVDRGNHDGLAIPKSSMSRHHLGLHKQLFVVRIGRAGKYEFPVYANESAAAQGARICTAISMGQLECNNLQVQISEQCAAPACSPTQQPRASAPPSSPMHRCMLCRYQYEMDVHRDDRLTLSTGSHPEDHRPWERCAAVLSLPPLSCRALQEDRRASDGRRSAFSAPRCHTRSVHLKQPLLLL